MIHHAADDLLTGWAIVVPAKPIPYRTTGRFQAMLLYVAGRAAADQTSMRRNLAVKSNIGDRVESRTKGSRSTVVIWLGRLRASERRMK